MAEQNNKFQWRDNHPPPKVSREQMQAAFAFAEDPENLKCDCWNAGCKYFGDCRACVLFHLNLKQVPTCQRELMEEAYGYYHNGDSIRNTDG